MVQIKLAFRLSLTKALRWLGINIFLKIHILNIEFSIRYLMIKRYCRQLLGTFDQESQCRKNTFFIKCCRLQLCCPAQWQYQKSA